MAKGMQKTLGTSCAESLAAAANVFVGHTERHWLSNLLYLA